MPDPIGVVAAASAADGDWLELLLLAVVQGLTEFLPVSSSGHLVLVQQLLGAVEGGGVLTEVALHVGTLGAVFAVYGRDLFAILRDALAGRARMLGLLALGSVPAGVVGVLFADFLEQLFDSTRVAAFGLLVTAVLLVVSDQVRRARGALEGPAALGDAPERRIGVLDALVIGTAQAVAICPGISRSGSTIAAGLLRGLDAADAARFSFLLSIPAIGGAALLQLRHVDTLSADGWLRLACAVVVSGLVGFVALRLLLVGLARGAFRWFALYTALLGATLIVLT